MITLFAELVMPLLVLAKLAWLFLVLVRLLVALVYPLVVLFTRSTRLFTRSTRLSIRLSSRSTRLSTGSICLSTGSICLSTRSTRSTICRSFYNWSFIKPKISLLLAAYKWKNINSDCFLYFYFCFFLLAMIAKGFWLFDYQCTDLQTHFRSGNYMFFIRRRNNFE